MSFKTDQENLNNKYFMMSWRTELEKEYNPTNVNNLLRSKDTYARYCGIKMLQPNDSQNVKLMYELIKDDREIIRHAVMCKLAEINNRNFRNLIIKSLKDVSRHVREEALRSLKINGDKKAIEHVYPLRSDKWHNVRLEAAITLYHFDKDEDDDDSICHILQLLEDKSKMNRLAAIKFIAANGNIHAIGPLQKTATIDIDVDVKREAEKISKYLLDSGILDRDWEKIFIETEFYKLCSLIASITQIHDERAQDILSQLLTNELWLEREDIFFEEDFEIRSMAASSFLKRYERTGDDKFIYILLETLINPGDGSIQLKEYIVRILSSFGTKEIAKKSGECLLDLGFLCGDYSAETDFYLLSIIVSIGGDVAVNILHDYFHSHSYDDYGENLLQDVFPEYNNVIFNKMLALLSISRLKKAHKLLADFLETEFFDSLSYDNKKKCIIAAGRSKAKITINNLRRISLNQNEAAIVRRKASLSL